MSKVYFTTMQSPVGVLTLTSDGAALTGAYLETSSHPPTRSEHWVEDGKRAPLPQAKKQLKEYFAGKRREFDLPLSAQGTLFQKRVWEALRGVGYGKTFSYKQIATEIEQPAACRAVGLANGCNPIVIIVPCHRVIGSNGKLTGYGGGIERKQWLLEHERGHGAAA